MSFSSNMSSKTSIVNTNMLIGLLQQAVWSDELNSDSKHLKHFVRSKENNSENCWELLTSTLDVTTPLKLDSLVEISHGERQKFMKYLLDVSTPIDIPKTVDVNQLLDINEDIGIQCPFCKVFGVKYILVQTRSGDEGMTAKCHCLSCGERFDKK